ncbi:MAG TPA: hypothetical protein VE650_14950 [Acetobacteraceae bacterium]|jgi:hypothetical protein|nr:hypothetical protein [Acetobacteraceae bacterium]
MGKVLIGAALLASVAIGAGGAAMAQTVPGAPGSPGGPGFPPGPPGFGEREGHGGFGEHEGHGPGMHMMRHPPRSAVFAFRRGETRVFIKCSDDEPTRACVDAASALLDKLGSTAPR